MVVGGQFWCKLRFSGNEAPRKRDDEKNSKEFGFQISAVSVL